MESKKCRACGVVKPTERFNRSKEARDGRSSKCVECSREYQSRWRKNNRSKCSEYHSRWRVSESGLAWRRAWISESDNRERVGLSNLAWRARNEKKVSAWERVRVARENGTLQPEPCSVCGHAEAEAHHEDYSKPLDVVWLCRKHHGERHRELNELERAA